METRIGRLLLALLLPLSSLMVPASLAGVCPVASPADAVLGRHDLCSALENPPPTLGDPIVAVEGDELALLRALYIVHQNKGKYVAVLFYASWCPFSKICRTNFDILSSLFPSIPHFVFEGSAMKPGTLSRYAVAGFPTLFLLNSTIRVRYRGSRTISSLTSFYSDVTGIKPTSLNQNFSMEAVLSSNLSGLKEKTRQDTCPFSWVRSPEKMLQHDTYLALASLFVLLRLLYFLLPKLSAYLKQALRRHMVFPWLMSFWGCSQAFLVEAKQRLKKLNTCKPSNLPEGAMSVRSWASKSMASVSIGPPSSSRMHNGCERR